MTFRKGTIAALSILAIATACAHPAAAQLKKVQVDITVLFETDAIHPGGTIRIAFEFDLEDGYHVQSNKPLDPFLIASELKITPPEGFTVVETVYPEPIFLESDAYEEPLSVFEGQFVIGVALEADPSLAPGEYTLKGRYRYQPCDEKACYQPADATIESTLKVVPSEVKLAKLDADIFERIAFTGVREDPVQSAEPDVVVTAAPVVEGDVIAQLADFTVLGTTGGYLNSGDFITFVDEAESGTIKKDFFEGKAPLAIVLLVMIGGLALNLTPCVLPVIPINLAIIGAGAQAGSRARGFALGGTYGLAMAAVYGALGLIVILTAGTFGTINSTVWFNAGIAVLFVVLGLAMFDIITIDFSKFQTKFNLAAKAKKGSFPLAFGMGGISALLAGACVAPVVIQVIVYASDQYTKGQVLALGLPFFLGIGMALPWPFAGAGLSLLPKPGPWMVRVKQVMGVFILSFAAYYAYLGWEIFDNSRVDRDLVAQSVEAQLEEGWTASLSQGLAQAKAEDKLVLVDIWATWCKNCLTMDKTTFKNEEVLARLEDFVKVKFQAEDLNASPAREVMQHFEGIGLPTYVILRPNPDGDADTG